jgi:alkylation response protein AidB-like acyl-CoA dehydrogenase
MNFGAVAVGTAEGALRDFVAMADTRRAHGSATPLSHSVLAQDALGESDAEVKAARAYLFAETASFTSGRTNDVSVLQCSAWVTQACVRAIERCYSIAGTSAIRSSSPLQRRLRDIHALSHHGLGARRNMVAAGGGRFGLNVHPFAFMP